MQSISKAIVAPTRDVILFTSKGGDTSTTSAPIKFKSFKFLISSWASCTLIPPTSGVPVPGANVGSMPSISKVKYVGVSPIVSLIIFEMGGRGAFLLSLEILGYEVKI